MYLRIRYSFTDEIRCSVTDKVQVFMSQVGGEPRPHCMGRCSGQGVSSWGGGNTDRKSRREYETENGFRSKSGRDIFPAEKVEGKRTKDMTRK